MENLKINQIEPQPHNNNSSKKRDKNENIKITFFAEQVSNVGYNPV